MAAAGARLPAGALRAWALAVRPKTLTAAASPVLVGTALALHDGVFALAPAVAAMAGALLIQVGTNLANDVLDYRRGADTAARLGPTRVVQAGLLSARAVGAGAALAFLAAAGVGLYLVYVGGWPILMLGVAAIACGILYTAGPAPIAYLGLGEVFVFLFFGFGAVAGTYYVQAGEVPGVALALGLAVGALSVAILEVNNLRDIATDRQAGKRTLAVRLGAPAARRLYALLLAAALIVPPLAAVGTLPGPRLFASLLAWPLAVAPLRAVMRGAAGRALNPVLGQTARLQMAHAALLAAALVAPW